MAADPGAPPIDAAAFDALMAPLGPFEPAPHLAVGVSGGPDSLALALLARDWARARGGTVTALTVDHGLRPAAAAEARRVADWMAAAGVGHATLNWAGPAPAHGVQAAARAARLGLLEGWCREHGVLDLLLAHHRDDQAETLLQRLGQGSGPDGLAGMAPVSWRRFVRLLRPLLAVAGARTRATLAHRGQPWIEDPSNADATFQRVRLRHLAPALGQAGVAAPGLALAAARAAEARAERARRLDARLVATVTPHPAGFAWVDLTALLAPPASEARAALGRLLAWIGGTERPPRAAALERLRRRPESGATLGRCRLLPAPGGPPGRWLVCREARHLPAPQPLSPGQAVIWDGRFRVTLEGPGADAGPTAPDGPWVLAPLGAAAPRIAHAVARAGGPPPAIPAAARAALPALWSAHGVAPGVAPGVAHGVVCVVPHMRYHGAPAPVAMRVSPAPALPLTRGATGGTRLAQDRPPPI
ncbi:tRNA lysidine(34) synthetase TilS [Roseospira goensis]|uniref:tRNA(Ile)-lysidine synthase n=1 Tax=Roseospira goensis TaxID=391922 RepID=A0A7W6RYP6_9PROT|nr:tRNA lysidine(34) synthetase TilS [Roseospira goensis]MBB4285491.1 tRNA(Ile)-lysidine synthase [Roseospira goensis]